MTKRELIEFLNELVELAGEENKMRAVSVKEDFISDFEKSYEPCEGASKQEPIASYPQDS